MQARCEKFVRSKMFDQRLSYDILPIVMRSSQLLPPNKALQIMLKNCQPVSEA